MPILGWTLNLGQAGSGTAAATPGVAPYHTGRANWHVIDRVRRRRFGQKSFINDFLAGTGLDVGELTGSLDLQTGTSTEIGGFLLIAADADITDSTSGTASGTLGAMANVDSLTDSTSGTADDTVSDVSTAVTGVDGTGNNAASKTDVDTRLGAINNNFKELVDQIITQRTLNTSMIDAFASLAADLNDLKSKMRTSGILDS